MDETPTIPAPKYYTDCNLPFVGFMSATVKGDLTVLIIEGEPTPEQLDEAWIAINSEYCKIVADPRQLSRNEQMQSSLELSAKVLRVAMMVESCKTVPDPRVIAVLKEEFEELDFDDSTQDTLVSWLDRILVELVQDNIELQCLQAQLNGDGEGTGKVELDIAIFYEILAEMSHYERRTIHPSDLNTYEFAELLKRLRGHHARPPMMLPFM